MRGRGPKGRANNPKPDCGWSALAARDPVQCDTTLTANGKMVALFVEPARMKLLAGRLLNGAQSTLATLPETNLVWTVLRAIWGNPQCVAPSAVLTIEEAHASATNAAVSFRPSVLRAAIMPLANSGATSERDSPVGHWSGPRHIRPRHQRHRAIRGLYIDANGASHGFVRNKQRQRLTSTRHGPRGTGARQMQFISLGGKFKRPDAEARGNTIHQGRCSVAVATS